MTDEQHDVQFGKRNNIVKEYFKSKISENIPKYLHIVLRDIVSKEIL